MRVKVRRAENNPTAEEEAKNEQRSETSVKNNGPWKSWQGSG